MGLFDLFSDDPAKAAGRAQAKGIRFARRDANEQLDKSIGTLKDYYGQANDALAPMSAQYGELWDVGKGALDLYSDALGLNGADGSSRALGAFTETPGSEYVRNESMEGIKRQMASLGMLNSGNTLIDLGDYLQNHYVNEQWDPWLDRLSGVAGQYAVPDPTPQIMAQNLMALGGQIAGVQGDKANIAYNAGTSLGDVNAQTALAPYYSGQNQLNAILGGATFAAKAAGMGGFG